MHKSTISAKVIQDSISLEGYRITTFELEYPRFIHSEFMTHRAFSRNAASSRAIPIASMHEQILSNTAMPINWGKNNPGMQSKEDLPPEHVEIAKQIWIKARNDAIHGSKALANLGSHKQIANRITECFMVMKTVMTATELDNWFNLRNHNDAQPEIHELAKKMNEALQDSIPMRIEVGEWHVPYIHRERLDGEMIYSTNGRVLTLDEARKISVSCCAQVSYRKNDDSIDKAIMIFDKLINSKPIHASPMEHQATPIVTNYLSEQYNPRTWQPGITHIDLWGRHWSNNFCKWIQLRALI
jgi:hypothetical protein